MRKLESSTVEDIRANTIENLRVYNLLTPEERAEVDAHNDRIRGKSIQEIIKAGPHPMMRLLKKYKK